MKIKIKKKEVDEPKLDIDESDEPTIDESDEPNEHNEPKLDIDISDKEVDDKEVDDKEESDKEVDEKEEVNDKEEVDEVEEIEYKKEEKPTIDMFSLNNDISFDTPIELDYSHTNEEIVDNVKEDKEPNNGKQEDIEVKKKYEKEEEFDEEPSNNNRVKMITQFEFPSLSMEEMTKRLYSLENEYKKLKVELIALKTNRNEPIKNLTKEKIDLDKIKIVNALSQKSVNGDFSLIDEYYLQYDPQPIKRKNTRSYLYFDRRWHMDNGSNITNIIINNLKKTYLSANTIDNFSMNEIMANQEYISFIESDSKYKRSLLNLIINNLFIDD